MRVAREFASVAQRRARGDRYLLLATHSSVGKYSPAETIRNNVTCRFYCARHFWIHIGFQRVNLLRSYFPPGYRRRAKMRERWDREDFRSNEKSADGATRVRRGARESRARKTKYLSRWKHGAFKRSEYNAAKVVTRKRRKS